LFLQGQSKGGKFSFQGGILIKKINKKNKVGLTSIRLRATALPFPSLFLSLFLCAKGRERWHTLYLTSNRRQLRLMWVKPG
jgi:hypothetical protein